MSRIVDFYLGALPDHAGRTIEQIWGYSIDELESHHDYIQWLFPNPNPSPVNPEAPVLDRETESEFARSAELRGRLMRSFEMMLWFYGFELIRREGGAPVVERSPEFHARVENWLAKNNHNHLRLTRILLCLTHCGLGVEARALLDQLMALARSYPESIASETLHYWRMAVAG